VRANGNCEVIPDMPCVWVQAWERSQSMALYRNEMGLVQPPVDRSLQGTSAWINLIDKRDIQMPKGWELARPAAPREPVSLYFPAPGGRLQIYVSQRHHGTFESYRLSMCVRRTHIDKRLKIKYRSAAGETPTAKVIGVSSQWKQSSPRRREPSRSGRAGRL
jgi:hypothetical protein